MSSLSSTGSYHRSPRKTTFSTGCGALPYIAQLTVFAADNVGPRTTQPSALTNPG